MYLREFVEKLVKMLEILWRNCRKIWETLVITKVFCILNKLNFCHNFKWILWEQWQNFGRNIRPYFESILKMYRTLGKILRKFQSDFWKISERNREIFIKLKNFEKIKKCWKILDYGKFWRHYKRFSSDFIQTWVKFCRKLENI